MMSVHTSPEPALDSKMSAASLCRLCPTVRSGTPLTVARLDVLRLGAEELVVVDRDHRPIGLVFANVLLDAARLGGMVDDLMATAYLAVNEEDSLRTVCAAMARRHTGIAVLVDDQDRLAGVLSAHDVVAWIGRSITCDNGFYEGPPTEVDG
jgi:CBS domain-containing protein